MDDAKARKDRAARAGVAQDERRQGRTGDQSKNIAAPTRLR